MITEQEFNNAIKEAEEITKWRDLLQGRIYKIVDHVVFDTQVGESMKLTLQDENGLYTVWAPERVKATLASKEYTHIRSNGLKPTKNGNNKYWSFDVVNVEPRSTMHC